MHLNKKSIAHNGTRHNLPSLLANKFTRCHLFERESISIANLKTQFLHGVMGSCTSSIFIGFTPDQNIFVSANHIFIADEITRQNTENPHSAKKEVLLALEQLRQQNCNYVTLVGIIGGANTFAQSLNNHQITTAYVKKLGFKPCLSELQVGLFAATYAIYKLEDQPVLHLWVQRHTDHHKQIHYSPEDITISIRHLLSYSLPMETLLEKINTELGPITT